MRRRRGGGKEGTIVGALVDALQDLETVFFNNMVIVMDAYFVHIPRTLELKDGNPLNEVRGICNSLMLNEGRVAADKTIKMKAADSVLCYAAGDEMP